jgi:tryptophan synthase beta chain
MVARFQSIISKEIKSQLSEKEGRDYPDYLIACVGGGSNAAGTFYHYLNDTRVKLIGVEAAGLGIDSDKTAATIHLGKRGIIHGSHTFVMQNEDGQITEPYSISAGLDYPGIGPVHANLFVTQRAEYLAVTDVEALNAALELTHLEGIIPALESSHALAVFGKKKFNPDDILVLTLSGRGDKDMDTFLGETSYEL